MMLVALGISLAAGCTRDDDGSSEPTSAGPGGVVSEDTGETAFVAGRFAYGFNDITARATFDGNVATLTAALVTNSARSAWFVGVYRFF